MAVNPILQALSGNSSSMSPVGILAQLKSAKNPQELLQRMPQYQQAKNYVDTHGGDPRTAFYNLAAQRGINPNEILNKIR